MVETGNAHLDRWRVRDGRLVFLKEDEEPQPHDEFDVDKILELITDSLDGTINMAEEQGIKGAPGTERDIGEQSGNPLETGTVEQTGDAMQGDRKSVV